MVLPPTSRVVYSTGSTTPSCTQTQPGQSNSVRYALPSAVSLRMEKVE